MLFNSRLRAASALGYFIFSLRSVSRITSETITARRWFIVRGNDVPGGVRGAGGFDCRAVGAHVGFPVLALFQVRHAELPVLVRVRNVIEQALALFFLGNVQEELYDTRAVVVEMAFDIHDGAVALLPD